MTRRLTEALQALRVAGGKAFVAYVTGGLPGVDASLLRAIRDAGADAIEVGIPCSDPAMDGPVIREASRRALDAGTAPTDVFELVRAADVDVPVVVMTYLNPVLAHGLERFAGDAADAGASGAIVPDLPVDGAGEWLTACRAVSLSPVLLAAPDSSPERLAEVAAASEGFVYCVARPGVTGAGDDPGDGARTVVDGLRSLTETPLLVGIGISTPRRAAEACAFADGAIVGTAIVEPLLAGNREEALRRAAAFRLAIVMPPIS